MTRFRRRPIEIEVEQFFPDREPWPDGVEYLEPHPEADVNGFIVRHRYLGVPLGVETGDYIDTAKGWVYRKATFEAEWEAF